MAGGDCIICTKVIDLKKCSNRLLTHRLDTSRIFFRPGSGSIKHLFLAMHIWEVGGWGLEHTDAFFNLDDQVIKQKRSCQGYDGDPSFSI